MKYFKMMLILLVSVFTLADAQAQVVLKARIGGGRDHRHYRHHHYYWRHHHRYDHWY